MSLKQREEDVAVERGGQSAEAKQGMNSGSGLAEDVVGSEACSLWAKERVGVEKGRQAKPTFARRLGVMGRREWDSRFKEEFLGIKEV